VHGAQSGASGFCGNASSLGCDSATHCSSQSDCPTGSVCVDTCCGFAACVSPCTGGTTQAPLTAGTSVAGGGGWLSPRRP
jgi:hypothetical protein